MLVKQPRINKLITNLNLELDKKKNSQDSLGRINSWPRINFQQKLNKVCLIGQHILHNFNKKTKKTNKYGEDQVFGIFFHCWQSF